MPHDQHMQNSPMADRFAAPSSRRGVLLRVGALLLTCVAAGTSHASERQKNSKKADKKTKSRSPRKKTTDQGTNRSAQAEQSSNGSGNALSIDTTSALLYDTASNEILFSKNPQSILPIASITKLMTALIVLESRAPAHEEITISNEDIDNEKNSSSRLPPGVRLTRDEMLHLALMSSENRAANALARHHPGGMAKFIKDMNAKAALLGMRETQFVEPTGLSSRNQSTTFDLTRLVLAASAQPQIRRYSTDEQMSIQVGEKVLKFRNTNPFVRSGALDVVVQKTGYIQEAGRCVVMEIEQAGRKLVLVLLDSISPAARSKDAQKLLALAGSRTPSSQGG